MKFFTVRPVLLMLLIIVLALSCSDDDSPNTNTKNQVESNVQNGIWKITKFIDSGKDETNHFTGYNFSFNINGVLTANNGTNNYEGSWSITNSSSDDHSEDDLEFNINFNLTNDFEDLNDDWDFISQSSIKIELIDISGGNGNVDYLTFEKN
jgi:mannosyltransferase OCH1-like enzyme